MGVDIGLVSTIMLEYITELLGHSRRIMNALLRVSHRALNIAFKCHMVRRLIVVNFGG